jgi:hypothetical protein
MPAKPASYEQCQGLPPVWAVAGPVGS